MSIDWSNAPDGYPVWVESKVSTDPSDWHRLESNGYLRDRKGARWESWQVQAGECVPHYRTEWDGEGLPPVGTVCEISLKSSIDKHAVDIERYKSHAGKKVEIVAHHDIGGGCRAAVYAYSNDFAFEYHSLIEGHFRPIRTAEQIAADEREEAAIELAYVATGHRDRSKDCWISLAKVIYDAGYRKQPAP